MQYIEEHSGYTTITDLRVKAYQHISTLILIIQIGYTTIYYLSTRCIRIFICLIRLFRPVALPSEMSFRANCLFRSYALRARYRCEPCALSDQTNSSKYSTNQNSVYIKSRFSAYFTLQTSTLKMTFHINMCGYLMTELASNKVYYLTM